MSAATLQLNFSQSEVENLLQQQVASTETTNEILLDAQRPADDVNSAPFLVTLSEQPINTSATSVSHVGWGGDGKVVDEIVTTVYQGENATQTIRYRDEDGFTANTRPNGYTLGTRPHGALILRNAYLPDASALPVNAPSVNYLSDINIDEKYTRITGYVSCSDDVGVFLNTLKADFDDPVSYVIPASTLPIQIDIPELSDGDAYTYVGLAALGGEADSGKIALNITGYRVMNMTYPRIELDIKAFLQGPYFAGGPIERMLSTLASNNLLPIDSRDAYPEGDYPTLNQRILPTINSVAFNIEGASNTIVDWVRVALRTGPYPFPEVTSVAALITTRGHIVDIDGTPVSFSGLDAEDGDYYVSIHHRNHLSIMSVNPLTVVAGDVTSYDFTDYSMIMDPDAGAVEVESLVWGMAAADVNQDYVVSSSDSSLVSSAVGQTGYVKGDVNMDGLVDAADQTLAVANFTTGYFSPLA